MTTTTVRMLPQPAATLNEHVRREIKAQMGRRSLSGVALARALGVAPSTVSKRLSGALPIDIDFIDQLCRLFGMSANQLLGWQPPEPPPTPNSTGLPHLDSNQEPLGSLWHHPSRSPQRPLTPVPVAA